MSFEEVEIKIRSILDWRSFDAVPAGGRHLRGLGRRLRGSAQRKSSPYQHLRWSPRRWNGTLQGKN